ncbi:hypothetical protein COV86_00135 [Candidatus Roizmanbacteria bacterium CG11_big_fil_rev_8_21_14_0_20_35_14]|uniref:UDP-N-acetylenolpyruvoylglucosamine reductase n=1 Tax=Candidatus Roizmanbacteria bacterium CG11_big_fil_rev_8_21_14_0_20_35_14 TaxID=1974855 RepID=A0A2H0KNY7_9BACT|nr:MAG: hypothetical protein COV86_00135 [Candidatus Roizmanbacteria bacterium CG11_big_fil_rev_8_21_14_0_20_35_14]
MLKQAENIFFVGIKGVAMANLALILKKMGKKVYGTDVKEEFITDKLLNDNKISWKIGFNSNNLLKNIDLIVYSAAHGGLNNPLVVEAKKRKISIISQAQLLGELMSDFKIKIAVAGCHGKTTTSSLLSYALDKLKVKPSYIVGVPFFSEHQGGNLQGKKYFIVEADEYGINPPIDKTPKFFKLNPDWIICVNIDFDHPDVYKDIEETKKAFLEFFDNRKLIVNIDNKNLLQCFLPAGRQGKTLKSENITTYGFSNNAHYQIINWEINEEGSKFKIKSNNDSGQARMTFFISLFGKHNISNATAVIVQLIKLGHKVEEIKGAIVGFKGAERRFELIYKKNDIYLFDDYAHHPNEIKATIESAKARFKDRRIIVIFQPHTYSRTNFLLKEFKDSLSLADIGFVMPIFASARENKNQFKVNSKDIVKNKANLFFVESDDQLINRLDKVVKKGDVVFTMGAGNVYKLKNKLIKMINNKLPTFAKASAGKQNLNLKKNKDLSNFLTLRNHVKAELFLEAKTREDLINAKKYSLENKLSLFMLGGGSNLAITKEKLPGLVLKNNYLDLKLLYESKNSVIISVSSGYPVSLLVARSITVGWEGFEYHQGLPGTVGGAIYMNSKWTKPAIYFGDNLLYAYLIDNNGQVKKVNRSYFKFAYNYSILQKTKEIVLEGIFKLKKTDSKTLKEKAAWVLDYRKKTQPFGVSSSGCFFRNPGKISAGYLIDKAGLKGFAVGDYSVSPIHANFIINKGKGRSEDMIKLLSIIKNRVKEKFGVELKEEVIII